MNQVLNFNPLLRGAWCYTTDKNKVYDYCTCSISKPQPTCQEFTKNNDHLHDSWFLKVTYLATQCSKKFFVIKIQRSRKLEGKLFSKMWLFGGALSILRGKCELLFDAVRTLQRLRARRCPKYRSIYKWPDQEKLYLRHFAFKENNLQTTEFYSVLFSYITY